MDVKTAFLNEELDEEIYKSRDKSAKCASSNIPFMDSNSHLDNGTLDFMTRLSLTVLRLLKRVIVCI